MTLQTGQPLDPNITKTPCAVFDNSGTWKRWTSGETVPPTHICVDITGTLTGNIAENGDTVGPLEAKPMYITVKYAPTTSGAHLATLTTESDAVSEVSAEISGRSPVKTSAVFKPNVDWQPELENFGEIVEGTADIDQCIKIILGTPKGSNPLRTDFGSDLYKMTDIPMNEAYPQIVRETVDALTRWEKRIKIRGISRDLSRSSGGEISLRIEWTLKESEKKQTTLVKL